MHALSLGAAERSRLVVGAGLFGVALDRQAIDRFARYAELLAVWSARMNLLSCRSGAELVARHLVDSLALSPHLEDAVTIADLGSGAGLPGVPLAISAPQRRLVLIESRRRRASFLREVKRTLELANLEVMEGRAEAVNDVETDCVVNGTRKDSGDKSWSVRADAVVCRAVWSDERVLAIAVKWLRPGGALLWMRAKGRVGEREAPTGSPQGARGALVLQQRVDYQVPSGAPRRIEIYRDVSRETS